MDREASVGLIGMLVSFIVGALALSAVSAVDLKEGVEQLAVQLGKSVPEGRTLRVAVTDFADLQGVISDLGRYIAERLTTRLSAQTQKFRVIERRRLGQVLGELRFSMSDLVDSNKAKQLGKMLGVEAIVVGTVSDLGNVVDIDARIIEIETNNILPGVTVAISKDDTVRHMPERGRQEAVAVAPSPGSAPGGMVSPAPAAAGKAVSVEGFAFEPRACRRTAQKLVCTVAFINTGNEERLLTIYAGSDSQLIDNIGNQYRVRVRIVDTETEP